jgi:hypothetical protein
MPEELESLPQRVAGLERAIRVRGEERSGELRDLWTAVQTLQRENAVAISEKRYSEERAVRIEGRLSHLENLINERFDDLNKNVVTKERYQNVERVVYGMVAIILGAFILALSTMVVK